MGGSQTAELPSTQRLTTGLERVPSCCPRPRSRGGARGRWGRAGASGPRAGRLISTWHLAGTLSPALTCPWDTPGHRSGFLWFPATARPSAQAAAGWPGPGGSHLCSVPAASPRGAGAGGSLGGGWPASPRCGWIPASAAPPHLMERGDSRQAWAWAPALPPPGW